MKLGYIFYLVIIEASQVASSCTDSETYTFENIKDGFVRQRKCSWLKASSDEETNAERVEKFCPMTSNGSVVQDECPISCNLCPTVSPTVSPTLSHSPTTTASVCKDSTTFSFDTINNGISVTRRCNWLTASSTSTQIRVTKWCPSTTSNGDLVKEFCVSSCDNCPTESPTKVASSIPTTSPSKSPQPTDKPPTLNPTDQPTTPEPTNKPTTPKPTAYPTLDPTGRPSLLPCADSLTFKWTGINLGIERTRSCAWLTNSESEAEFRVAKHCKMTYNGSLVKDECPLTCNNCASVEPTVTPTSKPTMKPTMKPTIPPTVKPTPSPTEDTTLSPSIYTCRDSSTYSFETLSSGVIVNRKCNWLAASASKLEFRTTKFCPLSSNGSIVKEECLASCNNCGTETGGPTTSPTQSPTETVCSDSTTFTFEIINNGVPVERHCHYLTASESKAAGRIAKWCPTTFDGALVKDECPVSCNNCGTGTDTATNEPTSSPTQSPTQSPTETVCSDSTTFTFEIINNGVPVEKHCHYLTQSESKAAGRIAKWCPTTFDGALVEDECPVSCNNCGTGTDTATNEPTPSPIQSPTETVCSDSTTFTFETINNGVPVNRKCQWLTQSESKAAERTTKWCPTTSDGALVEDECPVSCGACSSSSSSTSDTSTQLPTSPPTACFDSLTYVFFQTINGIQVARKCSWLTGSASKAVERTEKFCPSTNNNAVVKDECPVSCSACYPETEMPSSSPSVLPSLTPTGDYCKDSSTYTFFQTKNGHEIERKCTWLDGSNLDPITAAARTDKFCPQTHNGSLVEDECKASCNNCIPPAGLAAGNSSPSPSSISSDIPSATLSARPSSSCTDSDTFMFIQMKQGFPLERKCSYLTASPDNTASRVAKFCPTSYNGLYVRDECPKSCSNCPSDRTPAPTTAVPTKSPSSIPSLRPSLPPTSAPTSSAAPTLCMDDPDYTFEEPRQLDFYTRKCSWLTNVPEKTDTRLLNYCAYFSNGSYVQDRCRKSCSTCSV